MAEKISLNNACVQVNEYTITGVGGSLPCPGITPNEHSEEEFKNYLDEIQGEIPSGYSLLFVSHQPPIDTVCDRVRNGMHVGSVSIRKFIMDTQPLFCLTGHIHEGVGIDFIDKTVVVNPGPLHTGGYVVIEISSRVERVKLMNEKKIIQSL